MSRMIEANTPVPAQHKTYRPDSARLLSLYVSLECLEFYPDTLGSQMKMRKLSCDSSACVCVFKKESLGSSNMFEKYLMPRLVAAAGPYIMRFENTKPSLLYKTFEVENAR